MQSLLRDIRSALRQLRKNPEFALVPVLVHGLGISATTSIFSLVNPVVLPPLPFPESDQAMKVAALRQAAVGALVLPGAVDYPDVFDFRSQNHSFDALALFRDTEMTLAGWGEPGPHDGIER